VSDYTPLEQKFRMHNVYCEAQGPNVTTAEDHVRRAPYGGAITLKDVGTADGHGGFRFCVGPNSAPIRCSVCGAPLRRYELRGEGRPS